MISNRTSINTINIHNDCESPKISKTVLPEYIKLDLPGKVSVGENFFVIVELENQKVIFQLKNNFADQNCSVKFLYNPRLKRYSREDLYVLNDIFKELVLQEKDEELFLALKDGEGFLSLTPVLVNFISNNYIFYFIYNSASDGESRYEPYAAEVMFSRFFSITDLEYKKFNEKIIP